jgi:hypothetical protein
MNRWIKQTFTCLVLLALAAAAAAQDIIRNPPKDVKPAMMAVSATPPIVTVDGKADRLSPGVRIRGVNNLLLLPSTLAGQTVPMVYKRDAAGLVHEVWLLTPEEYAKLGGAGDLGNPEGYKRFQELLELIWAARWLLMR